MYWQRVAESELSSFERVVEKVECVRDERLLTSDERKKARGCNIIRINYLTSTIM